MPKLIDLTDIDDQTGAVKRATIYDAGTHGAELQIQRTVDPREARVAIGWGNRDQAVMWLDVNGLRALRDLTTRILDDVARENEIKLAQEH